MQKQYKTKDFYEASCLIARRKRLLFLEKDANFYWFVFDDDKDVCQKISNKFWRNELIVFARDYADAIRTLKDRIFAKV